MQTVDTTAFLIVESVGKERWKKSSRSDGRRLHTVETFCTPIGSVKKGVEGVRKSIAYPLISRGFLPISVRFRVKGHI